MLLAERGSQVGFVSSNERVRPPCWRKSRPISVILYPLIFLIFNLWFSRKYSTIPEFKKWDLESPKSSSQNHLYRGLWIISYDTIVTFSYGRSSLAGLKFPTRRLGHLNPSIFRQGYVGPLWNLQWIE